MRAPRPPPGSSPALRASPCDAHAAATSSPGGAPAPCRLKLAPRTHKAGHVAAGGRLAWHPQQRGLCWSVAGRLRDVLVGVLFQGSSLL